jgi:hypothetical protein
MFVTFLWFIKNELKEKQQFIVDNLLTTIESTSSYADHIQKNIKPDTFLYKTYLQKTLNFLNKYLGELKVFSFSTWEKHFTYSLLYSFFFFYIIWLFGGSGNIGNLIFLANENRISTSLYFIFVIITLYLLFTREEQIQNFLTKKIPYFFKLSNNWKKIIILVAGIIIGGIVGIIGLIIGLIGVIGVVVGVIIIGVGAGILGGEIIIGGTLGIVLLGVILVGTLLIFNGINSANILYLLFFLMLPFINSIFDYISMYYSRLFAQKILKTDSKWEVFVDIIIDLAIALVLLFGLAFTFFYTLEYTNSFITDEKLLIPIEAYTRQLLSNPFDKEVLWIMLMFFSTLIPTLAHLVLGLYSLLALRVIKPHLGKVVDKLNSLKDNDPNSFKKYLIAKELAVYALSRMLNVYMIIGLSIIIGFGGSLLALLIKMGFNIF